ncbi:MAG: RNA 2',3'-cyclic phosphodiesterase [Candidatus Woesearchaeota archaeon]
MKSRLFIGIPVSTEIKENILALILQFKTIKAEFSIISPENLHFTVKFLGDVEDVKIEEIKTILTKISQKQNSFKIFLSKLGAFPSLEKINVIWVGGSKELLPLMKTANSSLSHIKESDYAEEVPHLTIARVKSELNKEKLKEFIQKHQNDTFGEMIVDKLVLYKSNLTPEGPVYEVIEEFKLNL